MTETQRAAMQAALQLCENLHGAELRSGLKIRTEPTAKQLRAALAEQDAYVPEGWTLVPTKPTAEMLAATSWPGCATTDYAHMIAASPIPPRREWHGLTKQEVYRYWMRADETLPVTDLIYHFATLIEANLKEKNCG